MDLNNKRIHFAFRANMMIRELANIIREQMNPSQVSWDHCDLDLAMAFRDLDLAIEKINSISERIMKQG